MDNQINPRHIRHVAVQTQDVSADPAPAAQAVPAPASVEPAQEHTSAQPGKRKRRIWPWILLAVIAIIAVVGIKFAIDINNRAALFAQAPVTTPVPEPSDAPLTTAAATASVAPTPSPTPNPKQLLLSQADLEFMKNRVNILVLGVDESTERANWGSFRTDTMILVTIDFDTNDVYMISVPRDSYVKICGSSGAPVQLDDGRDRFAKINSAFTSGGGAKKNGYLYAMNTVSHLFGGIPINYYVGFNMNVVKEVVNAMGGVDYDVDVEINMNGRHLDTGMQHLDGQAVLDYCRQRKGDSDIRRVGRQQNMLKAIFRQLKSTGQIINIPSIYQAVEQNVQTNLTFTQISSLALLALDMDLDQLGSSTAEGTSLTIAGQSCYGLYMKRLSNLISDVFGISVNLDDDLDVGSIRAEIEAQLAAIASELAAARSAVSTTDSILSQYRDWLSDNAKTNLESYRDALSELIEDASLSNVESLVSHTITLQQFNDQVLSQLAQHGQGGDIAAQQTPAPVVSDPPTNGLGTGIPEVDPVTGQPLS